MLWFSNKSFIGTVKPVSINKNITVQYFVVIVRRTYLLLGGWYGIEWLWFSLDLAFCDWSTSLLLISGFWVGLIEILIGYGSENTIFHYLLPFKYAYSQIALEIHYNSFIVLHFVISMEKNLKYQNKLCTLPAFLCYELFKKKY